MSGQVVILISTLSTELSFASRRMEALFTGLKYDILKVDGCDPANKELRDRLFGVSGMRGKYPQCFIVRLDHYEFIGLWDKIEQLGDCESLSKEILDANPTIETVSKVFADCKRVD